MFYHVTLTLNFDIVVYLLSIYYDFFFIVLGNQNLKQLTEFFGMFNGIWT